MTVATREDLLMRSDGPDGPRRWRRVISHLWSSLHTSITVKTVMDLDSSALPCPPPRLDTFAVEASHTAASTRAPTTFRITHRELQGSTMAQQRLNNGSFGAAPKPVLEAEMAHRSWWRANPDAAYFGIGSSSLDARLAAAADAAAVAIGAPAGSVALVENATVATAIIASRWAKALREGRHERRSVLLLDVCYKAVAYSVRDLCGAAGGALSFASVPFPTAHFLTRRPRAS